MLRSKAKLTDRTVLISAADDVLEIHGVQRRFTLTEENYGMPPIEYVTQRGIFQHGDTVLDNYLRPRPVQLVIRWAACSRAEYWENRSALLSILQPSSRGVATLMHIRKYLANGTVRQLDVVPDSTPLFGPRDLGKWDEFAFTEALKFIAYDPTWYDPTQNELTELFDGSAAEVDVQYLGTWKEFPIIRITGPINSPVITNDNTGEILSFPSLNIAGGAEVDIDLTYGNKSAKVVSSGASVLGYLLSTSDVGTFHLAPAPEEDGENIITLEGSGTSGATALRVRWYDRFVGI